MPRDIKVDLGDNVLQRGCVLKDDVVMGRLYGNPDRPIIVVMGGISASRFIADAQESTPRNNGRGWWSTLVRRGGPIDLNRFQVLGLDFAPAVESDNRPDCITTHDQAARLKALLDGQGISRVAAIIGSSYGGMTALAFAHDYPEMVGQLCVIGAAHKPYPIGVAWRGIQRRVIELGIAAGRPNEGLKLARELAMSTYRSAEEFSTRFNTQPTQSAPFKFEVGDYLEACGARYHEIMPVNRFMALSESIDLHNVDPKKITTPTLLIATRSDQLAPPTEVKVLHEALAGPSELIEIDSIYGHDSFLKEYETLGPILAEFTKERSRAA